MIAGRTVYYGGLVALDSATPGSSGVVDDAEDLRQRIFQTSLLVAVVVGSVGFVRTVVDSIDLGAWVVTGVAVVLYAGLIVLLLARRLPYRLRAITFLVFLYIGGVSSLLVTGYLTGPVVILVAQNVLASVLFGRRATWTAFAMNVLAFLTVGVLSSGGFVSILTAFYDPTDLVDWLRVTALFAVFSGIAVTSVDVLTRHLDDSLQDQAELVENLKGAMQLHEEAESHRREAESRLGHAQKIEALGRLAGGLAHDFNNTLTVITSKAALLRSNSLTPAEIDEIAASIEEVAHSASETTHQLLTFARKTPLQPKYIPANDVAFSTAQLLKHTLPTDIRVEVTPLSDDAVVHVDPGEFQKALLNLAINARDSMPNGGVLRVLLRQERQGDKRLVAFEIKDSGTGMPEDVAARAFEPFFTTKEAGDGTGLGLAAVDAFAQSSGGFAKMKSHLGEGTTVGIYLPEMERAGHT